MYVVYYVSVSKYIYIYVHMITHVLGSTTTYNILQSRGFEHRSIASTIAT